LGGHNEQSLRVVDVLEKEGQGLNLTDDVRDGILHHSKPDDELSGALSKRARSLEGEVVRLSDAVAYINHDLDDAVRATLIDAATIPETVIDILGATHAARINTLVNDVVEHSHVDQDPGIIQMSDTVLSAANALRGFLFEQVYRPMNADENTGRAQQVVLMLCEYYDADFDEVPDEFRRLEVIDPRPRIVADYVASMTDRFAVDLFQRLYVPRYWTAPLR
jgi:dGTPase